MIFLYVIDALFSISLSILVAIFQLDLC